MEGKAHPSIAETVASNSLMAATGAEISRVTTGASDDEGRFVPGTLLGGRYRIIGLLGRGGMGEVYRATDLTLGQSVALKFLPEEASRNQRLLERFHGEVRVARLVSHPNVCRVYDIGEVEGMPFISMEYVDGEDLSSLLLRIGRLPGDKAIETARKLCAGLAAAHDRGVIHRDLKPQNIMMNRRGEVVIMDFGLAAIADQLSGAEVRNGTPAYMSPEQLKGAGVTARSDLYALGLVLYELFTGKRPFDAKNVQQLIDMQESAHLTSMTSVAADIDPAAEKVIRRCLDPDPAKRPATALAVMAALPGGDPLAAALAAGETPSPEMVLAAGTVEGMARKYSVPCLALVVLAMLASIPIREMRTAMVHAQLDQSPAVLAHQARQITASFGYPGRPADHAVWLEHRGALLAYLHGLPVPRKWNEWLAAEAPIRALYRESPRPLNAEPYGYVDFNNPPQDVPGMVRLSLDGNGRLREFAGLPPNDSAVSPPVAPETVFRAAGLDIANFSETAPRTLPASPFDRRTAWKGPHPVIPNTELTVDIAWWQGRVVQSVSVVPLHAAQCRSRCRSVLFQHRRHRLPDPALDRLLPRAASRPAQLEARTRRPSGRRPRRRRVLCAPCRVLARQGSRGEDQLPGRSDPGRDRVRAARRYHAGSHIPCVGTRRARSLAALHRHLESRSGRPLVGRPGRVGRPHRRRRWRFAVGHFQRRISSAEPRSRARQLGCLTACPAQYPPLDRFPRRESRRRPAPWHYLAS